MVTFSIYYLQLRREIIIVVPSMLKKEKKTKEEKHILQIETNKIDKQAFVAY